MFGSVKQTSE